MAQPLCQRTVSRLMAGVFGRKGLKHAGIIQCFQNPGAQTVGTDKAQEQ